MNQIDKIVNGMRNANLPSKYWELSDMEFPELTASDFLLQRNGQSVFQHTMSVIDLLTVKNSITLLSGLFHDLGKIHISTTNDPSLPRFPGHENESVAIAIVRLKEWGASPYIIDRVCRLIVTHMFDIIEALRWSKEKTIRNFIANVGQDNIDNWFVLRVADASAYSHDNAYYNTRIDIFQHVVMSYLEKQPSTEPLKFTEHDTARNIQIEGRDVK